MKINLPQQINSAQWLDRLGVTGEPDSQLQQQMEVAESKLMQAAAPQGIYRVMDLQRINDTGKEIVASPEIDLQGSAIKKHLAECTGLIVMAVTLGAGVDRLIRMSQIRDMAEAVILDAGASILAEQCADIFVEEIHNDTGGFITGRYSPGYGDFPVEMQRQLIRAVDGPRTIGLTTNESCILIPRKSITAIIGTADYPVKGYLATCDECAIRENCRLRIDGRPCWK